MDLLRLANEDAPFMPVPNRLAQVHPIEQRRRERLRARALFRQNALPLLLQELSEAFDQQILRRVRADAVAVQFTGPLAGHLFFGALLQTSRTQLPLLTRKPPSQANLLGIEPNFLTGNMSGWDIRLFRLKAIRAAGFPNFPGIVVVHNAARCQGEIEQRRRKSLAHDRQIACILGQRPPLPMSHALTRILLVQLFRFTK